MTYKLKITKSFKSDYKKLNKQEIEATDGIIKRLLAGEKPEAKYSDHALQGNYIGYRECHVRQDLLLVYKITIDGTVSVLTCFRISSHTNIFDVKKSLKS